MGPRRWQAVQVNAQGLRRKGGFPFPFRDVGWDALASALESPYGAAGPSEDLDHIRAIIDSVRASGRGAELAVSSGMLANLVVTPKPVGEPPHDVVVVTAPRAMNPPPPGCVRIEHLPLVGLADSITREVSEAVPLFWRFMTEKYGISSND